jgi:peroxiredoxin
MPSYEAENSDFGRYDAQVLGISVDSVPSHVAFAKSLGGIETYPLLADFHPKGEVSKQYGVWKEDKGICERAIVIIDKQGKVRYIDVHDISEQPENAQLIEVLRDIES